MLSGKDASGNQSGQSTLTVENIDKITPTATYGTNGGTNLQTASTTVTANDVGGSNIASLQYFWDIQNTIEPTSGWTLFTNGDNITKTGVTGTYYLWVKVTDNAGNSVVTKSNAFVADNIAPTNPTMSASTTGWTNGNVSVTITYPADAALKEYSINGTTWNTYTSAVVVTTNNTTVYAKATDASGNQSGQSTLTITKIDKVVPTTTTFNLNGYTSGSWTNGNVTQTYSSIDSQSGIQKYQYTVDGGANWYDCPNPWVINWDGQWEFYIRAIDNAGNIGSPSSSYIIRRDTSAPTVPTFMGMTYSDGVTNYINDTWAAQAVYMYGGISGSTDSQAGVNRYQISTDNVNWVDYAYNYTLPTYGLTSGGIYYRYARAIDNAGNASASYGRTIKIDGTAPNAYNMTVTKTTNSITISGVTADGESGMSGYHYYINGSWTGRTGATSYTFTGLAPGTTYSIYMTAYNNAEIQTGANGGVINVTTDANIYTFGNMGSSGYGIIRTPASTSNPTELCVNGPGQALTSGVAIGADIKVGDTISVTYSTTRSSNSWYLDLYDNQHTNSSGDFFGLNVQSYDTSTKTKTFTAIYNSNLYTINIFKSNYEGSDIWGKLFIYDIKVNGVKIL